LDIRDSVKSKLSRKIKGNVFFDELTRRIYAYSASICYLVPAAVIHPQDKEDVVNTLKIASAEGIPVTARGAGSGVAGQNLGEGLILDFSIHMNRILGLDQEGIAVVVEPGVIRSDLNKYLLPQGSFFPPDPSSTDYATLGGLVANNSGGAHSLLYGTTKDFIKSLTLVTHDGEEVHLSRKVEPPSKFSRPVREMLSEASPVLQRLKPRSYRNSCGYNLFEHPQKDCDVDFLKLVCGSEGTLGIITKIEVGISRLPERRSSVLLCYKNAHAAFSEVKDFLDLGPSTCQALAEEFLQLMAIEDPEKISRLPKGTNFILLVEFDGNDLEELKRKAKELIKRSSAFTYLFAENSAELEWVWTIRKSAAAYLSRLPGNKPTRWIEDGSVPVDRLAEFVGGIETILKKYNTSAAMFGHAGQGLLHFSPRLNRMSPDFQKIIEDLGHEHALFSRKLEGVPSGEHGDGLLRTPYLREIWGEVYPYFERLKKIFDPNFILNPLCVVPVRKYKVSDFLRYYKGYDHKKAGALNRFVDAIEACHGCGKCVDFCPVTRSHEGEVGSSRARMHLMREIVSGHLKEPFARKDLLPFLNLCLHCKTCARECPTGVDVARLIESYFEERYRLESPDFADRMLSRARKLGGLLRKTQWPSKRIIRSSPVEKFSGALGMANLKHIGVDPLRPKKMTYPKSSGDKKCVIFTGCVGDFFNADEIKAALALSDKIGLDADILSGYCCGEPAFVRGLSDEGLKQLKKSFDRVIPDLEAGNPVIFTSPSCLLPFREHSGAIIGKEEGEKILKNLHEACGFFVDRLMEIPRSESLEIQGADNGKSALEHAVKDIFKKLELKIAVQIPCHVRNIGADRKLLSLVNALTSSDAIELKTRCCGFGGSRGFEKKWAPHAERIGEALASEIRSIQPRIIVSSCVTCRLQIRKLMDGRISLSESSDLRTFIKGSYKENSREILVVHPLVLAHELLM
jgi:FAD/FMN-containing dehydrogenase/Fe-S oxidoreductase